MIGLDSAILAQQSVIGSMLIDDRCVPLVLSRLTETDFSDPVCRNFFRVIRTLAAEGGTIDPVTVLNKMKNGDDYIQWCKTVMMDTPSAATVDKYIPVVRESAALRQFFQLCEQGLSCTDIEEAQRLARKIPLVVSTAERMPMMTGPERMADFHMRMTSPDKPKYLPWGIPTADRCVYAELGDLILLGGYASSGKTLLSITMAMAQARAGYRVGYYSLETSPQKMSDRQIAALSGVPLWKIKKKEFSEDDWGRLVEAECFGAEEAPFPVIDASAYTVDDIIFHAIGHSFQVIYVDYVQNVLMPGIRAEDSYPKVTAISRALKTFSRSTKTAVVALAQLSRPPKDGGKPVPPTMHSFKESGQLEQDADVAFLVYPSDPNNNRSNRIFKIGKNKEGSREQVELVFHGDTQTMVELEQEPDRSVAAELSARGRAVKQANRAKAQAQFRESQAADKDNPFAEERRQP